MNIQITPKISNIQNTPIYKKNYNEYKNIHKPIIDTCSFGNSNIIPIYEHQYGTLKSIEFKEPIEVSKAFLEIAHTNEDLIKYNLLRYTHTIESIKEIGEILSNQEIGKTKVKSLIGIGAFALAFETENGQVLKITDIEHFQNGRKPAKFDLPIIKSGRLAKYPPYHYYLEEKVTQNDITQEELKALVKEIKNLGYKMKDYLVHFSTDDEELIKVEQFGRAKNGKIYLIDPGCAFETDNVYNPAKKYNLKNLFKKLLK